MAVFVIIMFIIIAIMKVIFVIITLLALPIIAIGVLVMISANTTFLHDDDHPMRSLPGASSPTQTPGRIQKVDPLLGVPIKYPLVARVPN